MLCGEDSDGFFDKDDPCLVCKFFCTTCGLAADIETGIPDPTKCPAMLRAAKEKAP